VKKNRSADTKLAGFFWPIPIKHWPLSLDLLVGNFDVKDGDIDPEIMVYGNDYVDKKARRIDIYRYPVLGHTAETDNGESGPLYYQVSRPNGFENYKVSGRNVDWYQPVHQNGNILSYPWHEEQIEEIDSKLIDQPGTFSTASNESTLYVCTSDEEETEESKSTTQQLHTSRSVSGSAKVSLKGFEGETTNTVSNTYDRTWQSMQTSTTTLSKSKCAYSGEVGHSFRMMSATFEAWIATRLPL